MDSRDRFLVSRAHSLQYRMDELCRLREIVGLPESSDLSSQQWSAIESQLQAERQALKKKMALAVRAYTGSRSNPHAAKLFNARLGQLEFGLSQSFTVFDTYMDIITQRSGPELGPMLAGCDAIADDALHRDHPALDLIERPIVYCDRGFGASILRQGKMIARSKRTPMPLIQIPYSRLREKYNLVSLVHEAGHEAMSRLGLDSHLPKLLGTVLEDAGAPSSVVDFFALWTSEIGPDFWAFCATGPAQTAGVRDILSLPPRQVFRISYSDPHPPPYLRVLMSMEWCRQLWGHGPWTLWRDEWTSMYPLHLVPAKTAKVLKAALRYLPRVADCLLTARLSSLGNGKISSLFDVDDLHPDRLRRAVRYRPGKTVHFDKLPPCSQMAAFRVIKSDCRISEEQMDRLMSEWLIGLKGDKRGTSGKDARRTEMRTGSGYNSSHA